jgi:hypothetical protein
MQACSYCRGQKVVQGPNGAQRCPLCDGTGVQWDPGREMTYEMGPISLNAPATAAPTNPQNSAGAASAGPSLQAVYAQIINSPFRWMFALAQSTFPFTIGIQDGSSGRFFSPQGVQIHSRNLFGDGTHPMPLPTPFEFPANKNIVGSFTDLGGAVGVCGVTNGSAAVVWESGGVFNTAAAPGPTFPGTPLWNGATINIAGVNYIISAVTSQTTLTLATTYNGTTSTTAAYSVANNIRVAFKGVELAG